jgi:hypothetical protein
MQVVRILWSFNCLCLGVVACETPYTAGDSFEAELACYRDTSIFAIHRHQFVGLNAPAWLSHVITSPAPVNYYYFSLGGLDSTPQRGLEDEFDYSRDVVGVTAISRVGVDVVVRGRTILPIFATAEGPR